MSAYRVWVATLTDGSQVYVRAWNETGVVEVTTRPNGWAVWGSPAIAKEER